MSLQIAFVCCVCDNGEFREALLVFRSLCKVMMAVAVVVAVVVWQRQGCCWGGSGGEAQRH